MSAVRSEKEVAFDKHHYYEDKLGIFHKCESTALPHGARLVWTACGRGVPPDSSFIDADHDENVVDCVDCLAEV